MVNTVRDKSRVSLELLSLFASVVEQGSISAAARQWNISPSLATRKMVLLESELNAHLLDRTTRSTHVTEAGRKVYAWATEVVSGHAALFDELAVSQKMLSGTLRIISNEYLLSVVLPKFLSDFSARYPEIAFALTMTDSVVPSEKRDYDVAIFSGQVPDTLLKGIRIRDFRRVLCASPAYLQRKGTPKDISSLALHDCLVHHQAAHDTWTFLKDRRITQQKVRAIARSSSHLPLIELAKNGMGIAQFSKGAILCELASGELITLLDSHECVNQDGTRPATWVMYPKDRVLKRTQVFVSELTKYLRGHAT